MGKIIKGQAKGELPHAFSLGCIRMLGGIWSAYGDAGGEVRERCGLQWDFRSWMTWLKGVINIHGG